MAARTTHIIFLPFLNILLMNPIIQLLFNPAIISLSIGFIAGIYTFYEIPTCISNAAALYLVFCIGLKGGMCLGATTICSGPLYAVALAGILIGFLQPFIYYALLKKIESLDHQTMITIATQYGSISIVTFLAASSFLQQQAIPYDNFMPAIAGIMEIPALFGGFMLLQGVHRLRKNIFSSLTYIVSQIARSKKISFIFLGFVIGYLMRAHHNDSFVHYLLWPFTAILIIFMLDIGIKIAQQRHYIHKFSWSLIAFGIYVPIISGLCSLLISFMLGLSVGTATLFAVLIASASYIAVPAVMSCQAPEAKEVIYLPLALGITLPFNILCGIPLFYYTAHYLFKSL